MKQQAVATSWWREWPWLVAAAIMPVVFLLQHVDPCDSTAAIAGGSSMLHIGLSLILGLLTSLGFALQPSANVGTSDVNDGIPRYRPLRTLLAIACCLAIAWLAIATIAVAGRGNLRFAVNGFWQWTSMLVWSASLGLMATRPGFARLAITAALALGVAVLVYGYWEYGVIQPELRRQLERDPVGLFRREGVSPESSAGLLLSDRIRSTEMKGFYALANSLGGFLACYWIMVMGLVSPRRTRALFAMNSILVIIVGVGLLLTKSRTAWLAAGGGTALLFLLSIMANGRVRGRTLASGVCIAAAVAASGLMVIYFFDPLILREAGKSLAYRFDYWRGATTLILRDPWLGYGVGGFQSTYLQVKLPTAAESPADPHNFVLETAHAGGIPCLIAIGSVIALALFLACARSQTEPKCDDEGQASRAITIAFWFGAILGAGGLIVWSIFTDSDERLFGILVSLATFGATGILCSRWPAAATSVHRLVNNRMALGVAFAVVLVHCLASGGWMLPGTMSLGMLAIGLSLSNGSARHLKNAAGESFSASRFNRAGLGVLGVSAVLLGAWYWTMAVPVSRSTEMVSRVLGRPLSIPSPEQLRTLLTVDPWDPELARVGMEWTTDYLSQPMGKESRGAWEATLREFQLRLLERDPGNSLAWEASGQCSARAAAATTDLDGRDAWIRLADQQFQRASELSPASAQGHIQAALAASWVGDRERSQLHCEESERIDTATRHRDRKIEAAQVVWPSQLIPSQTVLPDNARRGMPRDSVKAEPVLRYLRSQAQP